jgi:hypothetical protein
MDYVPILADCWRYVSRCSSYALHDAAAMLYGVVAEEEGSIGNNNFAEDIHFFTFVRFNMPVFYYLLLGLQLRIIDIIMIKLVTATNLFSSWRWHFYNISACQSGSGYRRIIKGINYL